MLSENGDVIKNRHDRAPDHSTVSVQNGGLTLPCGFCLDRRCSVDGRKRYENDKCGRESFCKRSKTAPFSFENGLVWTGPEPKTALSKLISDGTHNFEGPFQHNGYWRP